MAEQDALPLWRDDEGGWFLASSGAVPPVGPCAIRAIDGRACGADPQWLEAHRISAEAAKAWATTELGAALDDARGRIDAMLGDARTLGAAARHAPVAEGSALTADAMPALWAFVRSLPSVVAGGLSGDPVRVAEASGAMADLQWRLRDAGIELDDRVQDFPARLAALRRKR